jgi:hypothetical protein
MHRLDTHLLILKLNQHYASENPVKYINTTKNLGTKRGQINTLE